MRLESITVSLGYLSLPCIAFFENNCYCYRTTNKQAYGRTCTPSRFSSGSQYWPNIELAGVAVSNIGSTAAVQYATTMFHRGNKYLPNFCQRYAQCLLHNAPNILPAMSPILLRYLQQAPSQYHWQKTPNICGRIMPWELLGCCSGTFIVMLGRWR